MRISHIVLALGLVGGCAKGPELEPMPDGQVTDEAAFGSDAGVTMRVDPDQWWGLDLDEPELVQLHLEIDNDSGRPLLLRYEYLSLVAPDGRTWHAEDPERLDMVDLDLKNELLERGLTHRVIEDLEGDDIDDIEGNIYFSGIDQTLTRVDFHADLVDARTGEQFGTIRVPLMVEPEDGVISRTSR